MKTEYILQSLEKFYSPLQVQDFTHIGYSDDSYVYSFTMANAPLVTKLIQDPFEREIVDTLYEHKNKNEIRFLCAPINKINHDIYIFPKCEGGNLDVAQIKYYHDLAKDLVEAVTSLHRSGYIHGDLKPLNVCMHKGKICLIDFGTGLPLDFSDIRQMTMNSIAFSTPYQFCKKLNDKLFLDNYKIKVFDDKDFYDGLRAKFVEIKPLLLLRSKGEDPVQNDMFACGLLLAYVLSGKVNFWRGDYTPPTSEAVQDIKGMFMTMFDAVIRFMKDKEATVDAFIKTNNLDTNTENVQIMRRLLCSYDASK